MIFAEKREIKVGDIVKKRHNGPDYLYPKDRFHLYRVNKVREEWVAVTAIPPYEQPADIKCPSGIILSRLNSPYDVFLWEPNDDLQLGTREEIAKKLHEHCSYETLSELSETIKLCYQIDILEYLKTRRI